jgi:tetratricopeptide (TPR) repeat protein
MPAEPSRSPAVALPPSPAGAAQQPVLSQPKKRANRILVALIAIGALALVGVSITMYVLPHAASHSSNESNVAISEPQPAEPNDGTDPHRPVLPADEEGFVDSRDGWNWSNKCYVHIQAGKWGWAKAECDKGIAMAPTDHVTHAMLLYNEGLVAHAAGDMAEARKDFLQSLALRENATVRAALNGL